MMEFQYQWHYPKSKQAQTCATVQDGIFLATLPFHLYAKMKHSKSLEAFKARVDEQGLGACSTAGSSPQAFGFES